MDCLLAPYCLVGKPPILLAKTKFSMPRFGLVQRITKRSYPDRFKELLFNWL